jgi:hypothetical protein
MDLFDIIIDAALEGWDELKDNISLDKIKLTGAAGFGGAALVISKNMMKKKLYWDYLNWILNDCYPARDLTKHCYISGVQGSGKSNKLRRIFINSFVKEGWGGIYIDTHGTADIILQSIPPSRWKDVIYIAPWMGKVYGINVLQRYTNEPGEIDKIAEDVVDVFSKMYPRAWGDKIANCIRFATKAVLIAEETKPDYNCPTLMDVYKMLKDPLFREYITGDMDNEIIKDFFEALKATTAVDKLSNPLSSENVMLFLCQKEGINILDAMNNKKIIIANLDNNHLSKNGDLLASMLISTISTCSAKRKENDEKESPYFAIAMDEFHAYANKHIATLISQMRKKNVCVLMANQYRDQTPQKEIQSAISMAQFKFVHTPAASDESWVCKMYEHFLEKEKIIKMPFFHCIQDVHVPGKERKPYISATPYFKGDYDWAYAHKLKFASLHYAPHRYKLVEEINKMKDVKNVKIENAGPPGELLMGELPEI